MIGRVSSFLTKCNHLSMRYQFAKKKKNQEEKDQYEKNLKNDKEIPISLEELSSSTVRDIEEDDGDKSTAFEQRYYQRSAQLYDRYLQTQLRPQLTTDNYQINFGLILKRLPIHLPYDQGNFNYYRDRVNILEQTPYYNQAPNIADPESTYFYLDQEKVNPENYISHRNGEEIYAENSKFWRLAASGLNDPRSIQNRSTLSVFLIVKTKEGNWEFPSRPILEKQNFEEWKKSFLKDMTGSSDYNLHWSTGKPVYVDRVEIDGLPRGKGTKTFYFDGIHISGVNSRGHQNALFDDHLWVPKFQLGHYFSRQYFQKTARLAICAL